MCDCPFLQGGDSMKNLRFGRPMAGALVAGLLSLPAQAQDAVTFHEVKAPFEEVRQDLADAIVNRGYVIDYEAAVGDMLSRTGQDVGSDITIFKESRASVLQFCSAVLSRAAMEADIKNIAYCPYTTFVYEGSDDEGTVTLGFRHLDETGSEESKKALAAINAVLEEIVAEAAGVE